MPLLIGNNGVDLLLWNLRTHPYNYQPYAIYIILLKDLVGKSLKFIFALNLLKYFCLSSSEGIQQRRTYYGSLDYTAIMIEADESTPLLVDRVIWLEDKNNNNGNNKEPITTENPTVRYGLSYLSIDSSLPRSGSDFSIDSTKSFKSHFMEFKVLAFTFALITAISIATYLLVIESRLPSIALSLDLVNHDIWSSKRMLNHYHPLQHDNVDHIILMQTGNRNCDTSEECLKVLQEMQNNKPEELPFNFLIGGDGQTYEVRGWKYQSSVEGITQEKSLVIGLIGNFDQNPPNKKVLRATKSLIQLSSKRQLINAKYYIYGLRQSYGESGEGQQLFNKVRDWPEFKGFLTNY